MQIVLKPGQSIDSAIKKLKKKLEADNFFDTLRRHQFYTSKSQRRRLKRKKTIRRLQKEKEKYGNF